MSTPRQLAASASLARAPSDGRPRRASPLVRDVVIVLVVKAIVLYAFWYAFFRTPAAPGMTMDPAVVERRMLTPAPPVEPPHER